MGEGGSVRGPPGPEDHIFIQACSGGGPPAKGRRACRHSHSSGLEQGLWVPEAPGVAALLSRKGPTRARLPGSGRTLSRKQSGNSRSLWDPESLL